jgi:hypothetical protein
MLQEGFQEEMATEAKSKLKINKVFIHVFILLLKDTAQSTHLVSQNSVVQKPKNSLWHSTFWVHFHSQVKGWKAVAQLGPLERVNLKHWTAYISQLHVQGVQLKGIQKKKKMYTSETNCHTRVWFMSVERKTLEVFSCPAYSHVPAGDLRQAQ